VTAFLKELVGYGAASACALAVDLVVLWALVHFFSWEYLAAATTCAGTALSGREVRRGRVHFHMQFPHTPAIIVRPADRFLAHISHVDQQR
jgi:uncharacterized membrane protein